MVALEKAGYQVQLASRYISYSKRPGLEYLQERKSGAKAEAIRLLNEWGKNKRYPDLWFCYHPYDKSPDWLGMEICRALKIPMVTAEPCKTGQGPNGEWVPWRLEAQHGLIMADAHFVMTHSDFDYVSSFIDDSKIHWLKPFIDTEILTWDKHLIPSEIWTDTIRTDEVKLLAVGMMRPGAKMDSYKVLVEALSQVKGDKWRLAVIGGGPGHKQIQQWFDDRIPTHVNFVGELPLPKVLAAMGHADLLTWPGCREAYGMVYLEAAAMGTPSVALNNMGVPLVVEDGINGHLVEPPTAVAYAHRLQKILDAPRQLDALSLSARHFATGERSAAQAALRLKSVIDSLLVRVDP